MAISNSYVKLPEGTPLTVFPGYFDALHDCEVNGLLLYPSSDHGLFKNDWHNWFAAFSRVTSGRNLEKLSAIMRFCLFDLTTTSDAESRAWVCIWVVYHDFPN